MILQGDSRNFAKLVGECSAICTSPPYADSAPEKSSGGIDIEKQWQTYWQHGGGSTLEAFRAAQKRHAQGYGSSPGQIGAERAEDYWSACAQVYRQCHLALNPNGAMVVVIKDHVKDGKRVPLCDQTCKLLESCGFTIERRIRAWLVSEDRQPGLFGEVTKRKEQKSFFRRLYESRLPDDDPRRIDWEEVIVCRRT